MQYQVLNNWLTRQSEANRSVKRDSLLAGKFAGYAFRVLAKFSLFGGTGNFRLRAGKPFSVGRECARNSSRVVCIRWLIHSLLPHSGDSDTKFKGLRLSERGAMANPAGESSGEVLRLDFNRQLMVQFHGSVVTSDTGLLVYRELDDALGLTTMAGEMLADARTGRNGRHALVGLFRQSVFGRLAGIRERRRTPAA